MSDATEGTVVVCDAQTCGKGQQGNSWESAAGKNLQFSFFLFPQFLPIERSFYLSRIAALSIAGFLISKGVTAKIKWSNDIFVGDKKIAGILIEQTIQNRQLMQAVIGMGVNINQQHFSSAERPTSMLLELQEQQNVGSALEEILAHFSHYYTLLQQAAYPTIRAAYDALLYRQTGWHSYTVQNECFVAALEEVTETGALVLRQPDGKSVVCQTQQVRYNF
jgi:BirA family biotin operon repressor/biotin-[acetyl-CoA-carboxylase] ligase